MTIQDVLSKLERVKKCGNGYEARCPAHPNDDRSLTIGEGDDGRILLKCHVGCTIDAICDALHINTRDLFPDKPDTAPRPVAVYNYVDETGALLYQVVRFQPKTFRQRRPVPGGDWIWSLGDTRRVLYRLPDVNAAVERGDTIYLAEGEKDVEALRGVGVTATCNPGGAGKWRDEYTQALAGATVKIICDNDEPGIAHARNIAGLLALADCDIEILKPTHGKDAADHLAAGHTIDQLEPLDEAELATAHAWTPVRLADIDENEPPPTFILGCIYPNMRHLVYGAPESLKSWYALCVVCEYVKQGRCAMYVDYEMSARVIKRRLKALGLTAAEMERVFYIKPGAAMDATARAFISAMFDQNDVAIVVIDAFTGALAQSLLDDNNNIDVEKWVQDIGNFLWGPEKRALVIIDHVNKNRETSQDYSSGSKRKKEALDVSIEFETIKRLGRNVGQNGKAKITIRKDRPAWIEPYPRPHDFEMIPHEDGIIAYRTVPPVLVGGRTGGLRMTGYMEKISVALQNSGIALSKNDIAKIVGGKRQHVLDSIGVLLHDGYVSEVKDDGEKHTKIVLKRPYKEAEDPVLNTNQEAA